MFGLESPPKDPRGTVTLTIGILIGIYLFTMLIWEIWEGVN